MKTDLELDQEIKANLQKYARETVRKRAALAEAQAQHTLDEKMAVSGFVSALLETLKREASDYADEGGKKINDEQTVAVKNFADKAAKALQECAAEWHISDTEARAINGESPAPAELRARAARIVLKRQYLANKVGERTNSTAEQYVEANLATVSEEEIQQVLATNQ